MENSIPIRKAIFEKEIRIAVFLPKQEDLINKIKKVPNRKWSYKHLCWHFPNNTDNWGIFKSLFQQFTLDIQKDLEPIKIPYEEMVAPPKLELKKDLPPKEINLVVSVEKTPVPAQISAPITEEKPLNPEKITVQRAAFWRGRLRLDFVFRPDWVQFIKEIDGRKWHQEYKCWTIPHSPLTMEMLLNRFGTNLEVRMTPEPNYSSKHFYKNQDKYRITEPLNYKDEVARLEQQMTLKRMSTNTIKTYKNGFSQFLFYYNNIHPKDITKEQIITYMLHRIQKDKISPSIQNNFINAIKCYYEFVLGRDRTYYDLQRPKKPFQLPNFLSQEEIVKLMKAVENVKHRCILLAIYSGGLRLSEVTNLRKSDIRKDDRCIFIKAGKGKKDRTTLLSQTLLDQLAIYEQHFKTAYWLFEGQTGGQYSVRSVQYILREAVEKSGINPDATVHTLRHSFATHLVLAGHDILSIQKLMGHQSPETTEIYVHLTPEQIRRIQSPLDNLKL